MYTDDDARRILTAEAEATMAYELARARAYERLARGRFQHFLVLAQVRVEVEAEERAWRAARVEASVMRYVLTGALGVPEDV